VPVIYSLADGDGIFDMDHNSGVYSRVVIVEILIKLPV